MKSVIHCGLAGLLALVVACSTPSTVMGQGRVDGSFDRTLNVSGMINLDVSTGSGSIGIKRGGGNIVEIHGRIRAGNNLFRSGRDTDEIVRRLEMNPPIEQAGQTVRIGRIIDRDAQQNVSISYEIVVPAQANVKSHTGSGSQTIEGIDGRVEVGTGSGSISMRDIRGDLDAGTGSGSIRATNVSGGLRMQTGSGGIQVQGEQTGRWELQTGSGSIEIDLPSNAGFDLNAHTGSGGVEVGFPMTVQGKIGDRRNIRGKVGSGAYPLEAGTGSGRIRISTTPR